MKPWLLALFPALMLTSASCNLWPGGLGEDRTPYGDIATTGLDRRSLEADSTSEPISVETGLEELRGRSAKPHDWEAAANDEAAGGLVPLPIDAMRSLVLQNNLRLQVALIEPEIARARVSAEEGRFDALIGSRFDYRDVQTPPLNRALVDLTSDNPALDGATVKSTDVEQRRELLDLGLGVTVPLPTGGSVALETLLDQKNIVDPQRFEQYVAATRFSISQPLLRNAGPDASLASLRIARVGERLSEVRTKLSALRVLAGAEKAYWRLYAARRFLDVRIDQHRIATENLNLVRRLVGEGLTPRVEIARAEVGVYQRLESLIIAETEWRLRQRELKTFLAADRFPLRGAPMIDIATEPLLAGIELDRNELVREAMVQRLDLIEFELQIVGDGLRIDYQRNQALPIVNLDFQYGVLSRDDSFGRAWTSQWDFDNPDLWVGVTFEMPFTNQERRSRVEDVILSRARRLASKRERELMIRQEVLDTADVIERNWQRIVAARQNVIVAGVNYDAERRQFDQGLRTMREVLEALSDLGDAQIREIRAIVEYQVAQIDMAFATGTLLGYSRVDLTAVPMPDRVEFE